MWKINKKKEIKRNKLKNGEKYRQITTIEFI